MTRFRKPRAGDRQLSSKLIGAMVDEEERLGKFSASGGMSSGPGGICLPNLQDDPEAVKLVLATKFFPGAWGGPSFGYGNVSSWPLYETYGNLVGNDKPNPTRSNRKVYPQECAIWKVGPDQLEETSEFIKVVNLSSYHQPRGWYQVGSVGDDLYAITNELGGQRAIEGTWNAPETNTAGDSQTVGTLEAKIIRGSLTVGTQPGSALEYQNWAHCDGVLNDLFLHGPGVYEITFGVSAYSATSTVSPLPFSIWLLQNFNGQSTAIDWDNLPFGGYIYVDNEMPMVVPAGLANYSVTAEKTIIRTFSLDSNGSAGQVFNRLCLMVTTNSFAAPPAGIVISRAWIRARIVDYNYYSPGYNAFAGEKTEANPTGYQWWGGGPKPTKVIWNGTTESY